MQKKDFCYPALYCLYDLKKIRDNFVAELTLSAQGQKTSLAFIKNPLPQKTLVDNGQVFQVMVVGGSLLEKALVRKQEDKIIILSYAKETLPLLTDREFFLSFIEKHINPEVNTVALNFTYPLKPLLRNNILDGQLIYGTKEHQFNGLLNKIVGQEIENHIFGKHKREIRVTVANDTICLILAGLTKTNWENLVAGAVGTGMNFAFFLDKNTVVNLESGNFDKFPQTKTGKEIDKKSANPSKYLFEKEVAGRYLYQHYNLICQKLNLDTSLLSSTYNLNQLLNYLNHDRVRDKLTIKIIARQLLERSASLIACQVAGIYLFKQLRRDPSLTFIMEGSLFWQGWHYKENVKKYLERLSIPKNAIKFIKIKDSSIIGAAKLANIYNQNSVI